jgi:hypothetical protein
MANHRRRAAPAALGSLSIIPQALERSWGRGWIKLTFAAPTREAVDAIAEQRARLYGCFQYIRPAECIAIRRDDQLYRCILAVPESSRARKAA